MKAELWYEIVVRDRHGKVLSRERRKSRSFLKQWNQAVYLHVQAGSALTMTDIGGTGRSISRSKYSFQMEGPAADVNFGIVVGTDDTAVTISDYQLGARIAHGAGAGQLDYAITIVNLSAVAAPSCGFTITRSMTNNSGGDIDIAEAGLYFRMNEFAPFYYFCGVRDVLGAPHTVVNTATVSVQYTLQVTV